ncbi:MAG: hypothetical protein HPM95_00415 [Alphaproteobacteria bacterium]|nr:hypothetical protein [Alphaproteobacteria bacterium]
MTTIFDSTDPTELKARENDFLALSRASRPQAAREPISPQWFTFRKARP